MQLNYVKSKFVIRNTSSSAIKVMGKVNVNPNQLCDLFEAVPGLSEIAIIDALRQPDGDLYVKQKNGYIQIKDYDLVIFKNSQLEQVVQVLGNSSSDLEFQYPLEREGDLVKARIASEFNDGIVTKEDFVEMRRSALKVMVWQYQDFDLDGDIVKLSQFNNFGFNEKNIVSGSAVLVDANKPDKSIVVSGGWFSQKKNLGIQSHIESTVLLTNKVNKKVRVYFLVSVLPSQLTLDMEIPEVPNVVRMARVELMLSRKVDSNKELKILGEKNFLNKILFSNSVKVESDLDVEGSVATNKLVMNTGAAAGLVMKSNSIGDATWGSIPEISEESPKNPIPGQLWYNSKLDEVFYYNARLASFVSLGSETLTFTSSKQRVDNGYLDVVCGGYVNQPSYSSSDSFYISDIEFELESQVMMALELHSDGGLISDNRFVINAGKRHSFKNLCIPVLTGVPLRLYINGTNILNPKARVKIKKIA